MRVDELNVLELPARAELRAFVQRFLVVDCSSRHRDVHLPDTRAVAAFTLSGRVHIDQSQWAPRAAFTGPRDTLRAHEHSAGHCVLLATFTPIGASVFVNESLDELTGKTTDLADVVGRRSDLDRLHEQLVDAHGHRRRIALLEEFLLQRVRHSRMDPLVTAAIAWLEQSRPRARISDLARYVGLSQSALERRFRRVAGLSPKKFASVIRLRRAVYAHARGATFTEAALTAGYFDQSHFIHDFRRATGMTPNSYKPTT